MPRTRVLPWPYWAENPYIPRFLAELEARGVTVLRHKVGAPRLTRLRAGDWIHFHWPGALLIARARWQYRARVRLFEMFLARMRARGVRLAWTAHNLRPHDDPHPDLGLRARRAMTSQLDHVFVHFPSASASIRRELGYEGPITVIPHGNFIEACAPLADREESRRLVGLRSTGLGLLMLGRLRPYKGIGNAIRAFRLTGRTDDRLIIAGRPQSGIEHELAQASDDHRIAIHLGDIGDVDVARYHAAADAVLQAHVATFTSGTAVLALSFGCPVIGRAIHHLEALGPEPRVFATSDNGPEALARGIERRRSWGPVDRHAIREWAREELSWRTAGDRAAEVFLRDEPARGRSIS
jgi:beta-1,4-mannosyltransferase